MQRIQQLENRIRANNKALLSVMIALDTDPASEEDVAMAEQLTAEIEGDTAERDRLATEAKTATPPTPAAADETDTKPKTKSQEIPMTGPALIKSTKNQPFNLNKLILGLADKTYNGAGYEIEMSQECARKSGKDSSVAMIPWGGFLNKAPQDSITAAAGGKDLGISLAQPVNHDDLFTITSAASFKASAAGQLGVPIYQADLGAFKVPRMVEAIVPQWVARDTNVPTSQGYFDAINATPHTLGAVVQINRSALIDCAPPMQTVISDAIWAAVLSALDTALLGLQPTDADAPLGMYGQLVGTAYDYSASTPQQLLFHLADVADKNVDPLQFIAGNKWAAYATTTAVGASLDQQSLASAMPVSFTQSFNGRMNAYDLLGTPTPNPPVANLHSMFGPWSSYAMTVLFGGGVELQINPYADSVYAKGAILVRCMVDADILIRDASRFGMAFNTTT
jgi:hypothetical protein